MLIPRIMKNQLQGIRSNTFKTEKGPVTTKPPGGTHNCPEHKIAGHFEFDGCTSATDPLNKPKTKLEEWFTKEMFNELFYKSNMGLGKLTIYIKNAKLPFIL